MNYWYYAGFLLLFMIVYFAFLESRLFKRLNIQKWVIFEGKDSGMLTGKAFGLQQLVAGIFFLAFSIPILFDYPFVVKRFMFIVFSLSSWPGGFISTYTGLIVLLRPHVFGEESRYYEVCTKIKRDILLNEKIPLSYTEILFFNLRGFALSSIVVFISTALFFIGVDFIGKYYVILLICSYVMSLIFFTFIDKFNEHFKYDIRSNTGYSKHYFLTHLLAYVPFFIFALNILLILRGISF